MHKILYFQCTQPDHRLVSLVSLQVVYRSRKSTWVSLLWVPCMVHYPMHFSILNFLCTAKWAEYMSCLCSLDFSHSRNLVNLSMKRIAWKELANNKFFSNAVLSENLWSREELKASLTEGTEMLWHLKDPFRNSYRIVDLQSSIPYIWQLLCIYSLTKRLTSFCNFIIRIKC